MTNITGKSSLAEKQIQVVGFLTRSVSAGLTATPAGTQATALLLNSAINQLATVATAGDAAKLPVSTKMLGLEVIVINDGVAAAQIFGSGSDTIDGVATATGVPLTNAKRAVYLCIQAATPAAPGKWVSMQGGVSA